jgi:3-methylcrotonyl-CoA carboxylase alpha subunit
MNQTPKESIALFDGDQQFDVIISQCEISFAGKTKQYSAQFGTDHNLTAIIDGVESQGDVVIRGNAVTVFHDGETSRLHLFDILEDAEAHAGDIGEEDPLAPMPGIVVSVLVEIGGNIAKGDALMVIEAMKVEHTIRAAVDGVVDAIYYQPGDSVDERAQLIAITPNEK